MALVDIIVGREREDIEKYGSKGCIFLGKNVVGSGEDAHLTNRILMDVSRPHVVLIAGKRGSGKSYTGAVIAEEIMNLPEEIRENLSCLLIDTMGIFWSMKSPNERDIALLSEWGIKPKGFPVLNFVPAGFITEYEKAGIGYDGVLAVKPSELTPGDWLFTFGFDLTHPLGILLERVLRKLQGREYTIDDIINEIRSDNRSSSREKLALENRFLAASDWGIFSEEATRVEELLKPGAASVLDVSLQDRPVRNLLLSIISRKIYETRVFARREEEIARIQGTTERNVPMVWIIIDEAHQFVPSDRETVATGPLLTLVTQGRQPGISCVFITQRPNKLHETVITQADIVISHRLTAKSDLDALGSIMQTYLLEDIKKSISRLPRKKGSGIILDDNSERLYTVQVRPRQSWHAGESPIAIQG
ncbi:MAG: ATP-binding protein [Candidatus Micrarchaeota archaeon]|nr:ATP-binding protein [Candidatus Micrarchaeota archaeon]